MAPRFIIREADADSYESPLRRGGLSTSQFKTGVFGEPAELTALSPLKSRQIARADDASKMKIVIKEREEETYRNINRKSWEALLRKSDYDWRPPLTVNLPVQPVHSRDFVHVDCALNACRRRVVYPEMSAQVGESEQTDGELETMILQFALDDPPFVPDFRISQLSLVDNRYPVVTGNFFAWDLEYNFEYFCHRIDRGQTVLWVHCSIANEGDHAQEAHVRAKVNFQNEMDLFDYHYVPFHWDVAKWFPCDEVTVHEDWIVRGDRVIGRVFPENVNWSWEEEAHYSNEQYNRKFACSKPYFVTSRFRLLDVENVLHFQTTLEPEEEKRFAIALLVNYEEVTEEHRNTLAGIEADTGWECAVEHFHTLFDEQVTCLNCEARYMEGIFTELQISSLQLLADLGTEGQLVPTRGGSSERSRVQISEAAFMLRPLLRTGRFNTVRGALEFILGMQDEAHPPEANFTTLEGAIGTAETGWVNSTGCALGLAAEYLLFSHDDSFLDDHLPGLLRAADWIIAELQATRNENQDGTRPPTYGLMPYGKAPDGEEGHLVTFADAYTFWGLNRFVDLLTDLEHEHATDYRIELELYRKDLRKAIEVMTREDGFIERALPEENLSKTTSKFDNASGAMLLAFVDVLDVFSEAFQGYERYVEENLADHYFMGQMDREVMHIGSAEHAWHELYLRRGEWKKAFAAMQTTLKYGMTPRTWQLQERFSKRNAAFTPWQPNGSGNGRILDMIIKSFFFPYEDPDYGPVVALLAGIPFPWLLDNGNTEMKGLYTPQGRVTISATMLGENRCRALLSTEHTGAMPETVRFPNSFAVKADSPEITSLGRGYFEIPEGETEAAFVLFPGLL